MEWVRLEDVTLHSGARSSYIIDCSVFSGTVWEALAFMLYAKLTRFGVKFGKVVGVPRGGLVLASEMKAYITPGSDVVLLVDDVLTSGKSMREVAEQVRSERQEGSAFRHVCGAVVFARGECPDWIVPLFQM